MATPVTVPINQLPPGVTQIDEVRKWEDGERSSTRSVMDRQTSRNRQNQEQQGN
jgi:hypothetical protein